MKLGTYTLSSEKAEFARAFIFSSYIRVLRASSTYFSAIPQEIFFKAINTHLDLSSDTMVATILHDDDVVLGYSLYSDETLHCILVKRMFRGKGLAKKLIPDTPLTYTSMFLNKKNKNLLKSLDLHLTFNPYY